MLLIEWREKISTTNCTHEGVCNGKIMPLSVRQQRYALNDVILKQTREMLGGVDAKGNF